MSLDKALKNVIFDKRLVEIYINRGLVKREDYEKHLKELADLSHNVEMVSVSGESSSSDPETSH